MLNNFTKEINLVLLSIEKYITKIIKCETIL